MWFKIKFNLLFIYSSFGFVCLFVFFWFIKTWSDCLLLKTLGNYPSILFLYSLLPLLVKIRTYTFCIFRKNFSFSPNQLILAHITKPSIMYSFTFSYKTYLYCTSVSFYKQVYSAKYI